MAKRCLKGCFPVKCQQCYHASIEHALDDLYGLYCNAPLVKAGKTYDQGGWCMSRELWMCTSYKNVHKGKAEKNGEDNQG